MILLAFNYSIDLLSLKGSGLINYQSSNLKLYFIYLPIIFFNLSFEKIFIKTNFLSFFAQQKFFVHLHICEIFLLRLRFIF